MTGRRVNGCQASVVVAVDVVDAVEAGLVSEEGDHCALMAVPTGRPGAVGALIGRRGATVALIGRRDVRVALMGRQGAVTALIGHLGVSVALIGCRGENRGAPAAARCVIGRCRPSEVLRR